MPRTPCPLLNFALEVTNFQLSTHECVTTLPMHACIANHLYIIIDKDPHLTICMVSVFGLELLFQMFLFSCGEALKKNKDLITEEQYLYQKELQRNYKSLHEKLDPLLRNRFGTLRGSVGMRKK